MTKIAMIVVILNSLVGFCNFLQCLPFLCGGRTNLLRRQSLVYWLTCQRPGRHILTSFLILFVVYRLLEDISNLL